MQELARHDGAIVRVAEAVWGTACTAYMLARHVTAALGSIAATVGRATRSLAKLSRPLIATIAIILVAASSAWCQTIVIDLTNLVQNTISALKMIESVINEATMIANQLEQIRVLIQNTTNYPEGIWDREALPRLLRLGQIIEQEQALAYTLANVDRLFRERYPGYRPVTDWAREYDQLDAHDAGHAPRHPARGAPPRRGLRRRAGAHRRSTALSDSAVGRMQAVQTGNMIAAEQVQQLVKLRQLVMAQVNAQNVYMASQTNREAQRAATQSEWIRNGNTRRAAPRVRRPRPARASADDRARPCDAAVSSWRSSPLPSLAGCARDPSAEALESLSASAAVARYHSGFWAAEASKQTPLWTKAQTYCRVPDHEDRPNCRIVVAVDVTVRILAVRPGRRPERAGAAVGPRRHPGARPPEARRGTAVRPGSGLRRAAQDAAAAREIDR